MSPTVIQVENLSKRYRLGVIGRTALHEDLGRWWARLRGKPDPTLRIDQLAQIEARGDAVAEAQTDHIWALRDVNISLKQGEVLGIIGRNGSGKSTLLKILARVTAPTLGCVKIKGRVASLLEVGTGFNPELTGRENVFLNGAIMGMTKQEVRSRFDEIVAFSGCEQYIDTPVKRYSSGMVVRLAFAVAAHLDPEILIVDEVLAVGDVEFQRKCIGKMQDVASHGRTVLFVSHNMGMINKLCTRAVVMRDGRLIFSGATQEAIEQYYESSTHSVATQKFAGSLSSIITLHELGVNQNFKGNSILSPSQSIALTIRGHARQEVEDMRFRFSIYHRGILLLTLLDLPEFRTLKQGDFETRVTLPAYCLRPGEYELGFGGGNAKNTAWFYSDSIAQFNILEEWDDDCERLSPGLMNLTRGQFHGERDG